MSCSSMSNNIQYVQPLFVITILRDQFGAYAVISSMFGNVTAHNTHLLLYENTAQTITLLLGHSVCRNYYIRR